ncbi:MAG: CRTAC1 family protein [Acidobacteria bacterium]|nr:MAG: CRTAC1 family protein [Acidobacteriota bacterium]
MRAVVGAVLFALVAAGIAAFVAPVSFDPVVFDEVAAARGVRFVTNSGRTARKHQPETMVAGVALLDYDNDGWLDIYAVNGAKMPSLEKSGPEYWNRLFHNNGDGTFTDVTEKAGVAGRGYDLGVATGDYDNDGYTDLFVAGLRGNTLYHNNGNGTFTNVTEKAGLARPDPKYGTLWAVAAAFADYDHDGKLDLFVSNYCVWDPATEPLCGNPSAPDYCHPRQYEGLPNALFHNNGDGTFTDVSVASGIRAHVGKGMGIGVADFDGDGWTDFFVSNDTVPSFLFMNNRNGTFTESAFERAVAFTERAEAVSGMGADARDVDNDGRPDIFQTALANETFPLFKNVGEAMFEEITARSGVGALSRGRSGWGNGIVDLNNDGWKDLFVACADVMDPGGNFRERVPLANTVFVNLADGRFADGGASAGEAFARKAVHRGAAFGDIDNDGRVDVVVSALDGPLEVWRNVSPASNHWLAVRTIGTRSNRDGVGAKIKIVTKSGAQYDHVNTAVGYGCASDRRVHFGLGKDGVVGEMTITWPSGKTQTLKQVTADQVLTVREPE